MVSGNDRIFEHNLIIGRSTNPNQCFLLKVPLSQGRVMEGIKQGQEDHWKSIQTGISKSAKWQVSAPSAQMGKIRSDLCPNHHSGNIVMPVMLVRQINQLRNSLL
jgi:hypothetical protein